MDETGRKPLIKSGRPFTSLDDSSLKAAMAIQAQQQSSDSNPGDRSGGDNSPNSKATRIVRNLNEFLSLKEKNRTTNSFSNTNVTEQQDGTSPDDASNYFPITTSVTR